MVNETPQSDPDSSRMKQISLLLVGTALASGAVPCALLGLTDSPLTAVGGIVGAGVIGFISAWIYGQRLHLTWDQDIHDSVDAATAKARGPLDQLKQAVAKSGLDLAAQSKRLTTLTDEHQERASMTTSAAARALENATVIAGAVEEMNAAIMEIERQAEDATKIAGQAVSKANEADESVTQLTDRANKIITMVELIRGIAQKTNLLALNASIEAARAGEHGRGFNVVAQEVKSLANQTAEITQKIEDQIEGVRQASLAAREGMQSVGQVIGEMGNISQSIRRALEQESVATQEIAAGALATSSATNEATEGISHLLVTTEEIRRASTTLDEVLSQLMIAKNQSN